MANIPKIPISIAFAADDAEAIKSIEKIFGKLQAKADGKSIIYDIKADTSAFEQALKELKRLGVKDFKLQIDDSVLKGLSKEARTAFDSLEKEAKQLGITIGSSFDGSKSDVDKLTKSVDELSAKLKEQEKILNKLKSKDSSKKDGKLVDDEEFKKLSSELENTKQDIKELQSSIELLKTGSVGAERFIELRSEIDKVTEALKEQKAQMDKLSDAPKQRKNSNSDDNYSKKILNDANRKLVGIDVKLSNLDESIYGVDKLKNKLEELKAESKNVGDERSLEKFKQDVKSLDKECDDLIKTQNRLNKEAKELSISRLDLRMSDWLERNTGAPGKLINDVKRLREELKKVGATDGDIRKIANAFNQIQSSAKDAGKNGLSFFDRWKNRMGELVMYMSTFASFYDVINTIKRMGQEVIKVDTAVTELKKVSSASSQEIANYFNIATDNAKDLGSSISDAIQAASDWSRMGYNLPDADELAKVSMLYKNVGDGISIDEANESLISTLRGFKLEAKDTTGIIDRFNEVSNNMPISSAGIGEALQRSAASFHAANTDLSSAISLITASNSVVQDPTRVGNAWKTISARIRSADQEIIDMGEDTEGMVKSTSKLREDIEAVTGFDIMKDENTFKDMREIIIGIGEAWGGLSNIEQAGLLEKLAGKNHANTLAATLENVDMIKESYEIAENSAGSAMREQARYEESVQYSIDRLTASAQEFANITIDSGFLKGLIDGGNTLLNIFTKLIDTVGLLPTILGGVGIAGFIKNLDWHKSSATLLIFSRVGLPSQRYTVMYISRNYIMA